MFGQVGAGTARPLTGQHWAAELSRVFWPTETSCRRRDSGLGCPIGRTAVKAADDWALRRLTAKQKNRGRRPGPSNQFVPTFIFPGQQAPSKAAHHWLPCPANTSSSSVQRRRHGSSCHHHRYFAHCPCHFTAKRPKHPQWQQRLSPTALISRPPTGTVRRSPAPHPLLSQILARQCVPHQSPLPPSIAITAAALLPSLDSIPIPAKVCDWPLGRPIGALLFGSLAALCPYQPPLLPALACQGRPALPCCCVPAPFNRPTVGR